MSEISESWIHICLDTIKRSHHAMHYCMWEEAPDHTESYIILAPQNLQNEWFKGLKFGTLRRGALNSARYFLPSLSRSQKFHGSERGEEEKLFRHPLSPFFLQIESLNQIGIQLPNFLFPCWSTGIARRRLQIFFDEEVRRNLRGEQRVFFYKTYFWEIIGHVFLSFDSQRRERANAFLLSLKTWIHPFSFQLFREVLSEAEVCRILSTPKTLETSSLAQKSSFQCAT